MCNACRSRSTVAMKRAVTWLLLPTTVEPSLVTFTGYLSCLRRFDRCTCTEKKSHFHQSSELVDAVRLMYTWTVAERASDVTAFEPQRARPSMKQNDCVYVVSVMRMHPYIRSICKLKGTVLCSRHNSRGLDMQGAQTYEAGIKF